MKKSKNVFGAFLMICVIVVFPIVSYIVTMKGAEAGRLFFSVLKKNLGTIPNYSENDIRGNLQTADALRGSIVLFSVLQNGGADSVISVLRIINKTEQFREEVDNFKLITFYDSLNTDNAHRLDTQISAADKERWIVLPLNDSIKKIILPNDYSIGLVDTVGIIRHFYDTRLLPDKQLLVQHLALMPIKKKKDVVKAEQRKM
jgi:hypothetical protein